MGRNYRLEIIAALGGKCQWHEGCEITDPDMLQVDHVHGGGTEHRLRYTDTKVAVGGTAGTIPGFLVNHNGYYKDILSSIDSGDYQVLCANHNAKKAAISRRTKKQARGNGNK